MAITWVASAEAQGWIEPPPAIIGQRVVKVRSAVHVTVTGRVAEVEVEEWFRNDGGILGEGDYLYPLPGEAVFSNFSLFQGDQELRGETMDAGQARAIYEEIVRRKRDPALIELVGHGMIRARVFPINPGDTRKITLRYSQVLDRAGDALQFRYAAGTRHVAGPVVDGTPVRRNQEVAPLAFTLETDDGDQYRDPFSPTHELRVDRDDGRLTVEPVGTLEGDLSVFLPLARGIFGVTVATHRPSSEDGYFMLTLSPGVADGAVQPRDVTVVLDVSGSMSGEKLRQAKAALRQLLNSLDQRDRFRLIAFSNAVRVMEGDWTRATRANLREAREWVDGLGANGGTNIAGALREAFALESPNNRFPVVLFVTDGLPSVGERDPERIAADAEAARGDARVFAFGVGHDVNTYLLDRLSAAGRGSTEYVSPSDDVERAIGLLAAKIQHPVLANLVLDDTPVRVSEIYPTQLPDLFAGEDLIVFGRYTAGRRDQSGNVVMRGRRGGRTERFATEATFPRHELANDFIPRLWASRKLGHLARQIRLEGHTPEREREIRELAMQHGLLSEYTSYLVQEPNLVANRPVDVRGFADRTRPMPTAAPAPDRDARRRAASGAGAFEQARRDGARRQVASVAELDAIETEAPTADSLSLGRSVLVRTVAGRHFTLVDGVWTDAAHRSGTEVIEVEPFSAAYFALLRAAPELERWLTAFERVLVAGGEVSVKIVAGGRDALSDAEAQRLVRRFRGH